MTALFFQQPPHTLLDRPTFLSFFQDSTLNQNEHQPKDRRSRANPGLRIRK
jgi:hypothetical protein